MCVRRRFGVSGEELDEPMRPGGLEGPRRPYPG